MANEIRNFRAALAQNDRNKPVFTILVIELMIVSVFLAGILGYVTDSDTVFGLGFVIIISLLTSFLVHPWTALVTFIILGLGWASPFIALAFYWNSFAAGFIGFIAFGVSFIVNYWGYTYFLDLSAYDD